jgi:hypothetical protein
MRLSESVTEEDRTINDMSRSHDEAVFSGTYSNRFTGIEGLSVEIERLRNRLRQSGTDSLNNQLENK